MLDVGEVAELRLGVLEPLDVGAVLLLGVDEGDVVWEAGELQEVDQMVAEASDVPVEELEFWFLLFSHFFVGRLFFGKDMFVGCEERFYSIFIADSHIQAEIISK